LREIPGESMIRSKNVRRAIEKYGIPADRPNPWERVSSGLQTRNGEPKKTARPGRTAVRRTRI